MVGGPADGYEGLKPILRKVAAQASGRAPNAEPTAVSHRTQMDKTFAEGLLNSPVELCAVQSSNTNI